MLGTVVGLYTTSAPMRGPRGSLLLLLGAGGVVGGLGRIVLVVLVVLVVAVVLPLLVAGPPLSSSSTAPAMSRVLRFLELPI